MPLLLHYPPEDDQAPLPGIPLAGVVSVDGLVDAEAPWAAPDIPSEVDAVADWCLRPADVADHRLNQGMLHPRDLQPQPR